MTGGGGIGLTRIVEAVVHSADVDGSAAFGRALDLDVLESGRDGVLLGVDGSTGGRLRIVPAAGGTVGSAPEVWDLGPRLLGMYSRNLDITVAAAEAAGGRALEPASYAYGTARMHEVVLQGPDGLWWTIPQVPEPPMSPQPSPALEAGPTRIHGELHSAVVVVPDHDAAVRFFVGAGEMTPVFDGEMSGEPFERLVGMPAGAIMRLAFLVGPDRAPGRLEVMSFTGVPVTDRSADPVGLRRLVMAARDVERTRRRLLDGGGTALSDTVVSGPAGVEIELVPECG